MEAERKTPAHVELTKDAGEQAEKTGGLIAPGMIKSASVTIAETEIPLWYDLRAQIQIEEELEMSYDTLRETINNLKNPLNTKTVIRTIRILGNRGLAKNGEKVRLTDEWLYDHVRQPDMLAYKIALLGALTAGWYMETDDSTQGEIDLGLMEIRKKKRKNGLSTRKLIHFGLTAGLRMDEMMGMAPGMIIDLYAWRQEYDDQQHGVQRG